MMETLNVPYIRQKPGRYGAGLRAAMRTADPGRKLDLLLIGALIEARSAERFCLLAPRLPGPLGGFLRDARAIRGAALRAVSRARTRAWIRRRVEPSRRGGWAMIAAKEAELATAPDDAFSLSLGAPGGGGSPDGAHTPLRALNEATSFSSYFPFSYTR